MASACHARSWAEIPIDINNDDDFQSWMQPILIYLILHGRVPRPSQNAVIRRNHRKAMERMITRSFDTLLRYVTCPSALRILGMIRAVDEGRVGYIRQAWPVVVTHGLVKYGWYNPGQVVWQNRSSGQEARAARAAQRPTETFRPLQTYYHASLAATLEEFERLSLQEVQDILSSAGDDGEPEP
jgi:hypothetical protein